MDPSEFARFCSDHGIPVRDQTIIRLWQIGLLRADIVTATRTLRKAGLVRVGEIGTGQYAYADNRPYKGIPGGAWRGGLPAQTARFLHKALLSSFPLLRPVAV